MSNPNVLIDREKYIGGSDLPTILGYNIKYGTKPFHLALEKAGIVEKSFKGNEFTVYGQKLEPVIRDYINSYYGVTYKEDTIIDEIRHYRGNTDGIDRNADVPILEVKTFGDELDVDYYNAQCQFYMEMFDQDYCLLVGYKRPKNFYTGLDYNLENTDQYFNLDFNEDNLVKYVLNRDKEKWRQIDETIKKFQEAVTYLKENKDSYSEAKFNEIFYGKELIELSKQMTALELLVSGFKETENQYKDTKEKLYKLFDEMGIISFDTETMKITKINPTSYKTESIDTTKLKEEEKEIYEKYKTIKTTNKKGYLLITNKKLEEKKK